MTKYKYIGTEEQLIEYGFEKVGSGNYQVEIIHRAKYGEITILEYDNKKHVRAWYEDDTLGFIECNVSHIRFVKNLIEKGLVIVDE